MKNIFKRQSFIFLSLSVLFIFYGCSDDSKNESTDNQQITVDSTSMQKEPLTVKDTIEASLAEAMERLRLHDNSGLYENEFAYLTDETSFDEYLTFGQITQRPPGSVTNLAVDSLEMFAHDSASVWVTINVELQDGSVKELTEQKLVVYYHNNRWIKPTVSVIKNQVEYEDLIRQAEEASKWEDE
ncbi:MAG TPA: hypothetical protein ENH23_00545 [candidate division Zixibacteria bacterium]|nr:hypothetical protein [candidate division Zixibacteria bacterium]